LPRGYEKLNTLRSLQQEIIAKLGQVRNTVKVYHPTTTHPPRNLERPETLSRDHLTKMLSREEKNKRLRWC